MFHYCAELVTQVTLAGIDVVSDFTKKKPDDPDVIKIKDIRIFSNYSPKISAHALIFPPGWGLEKRHYDPENIMDYWLIKEHRNVLLNTLVTYGEFVSSKLIQHTPLPIDDRSISKILSSKVEPRTYTPGKIVHADSDLNWESITFNIRRVIFETRFFKVSKIEQYTTISDILAAMPSHERDYLKKFLDMFMEVPLEHLPAMVDLGNMRYILRKLKPANVVPLLYETFASPTWSGKLTAIIKLIEIFEIDYYDVVAKSVDSIASLILKVASFVMEKTELSKTLAKDGFNWVFCKSDEEKKNEEDVVLQSSNVCAHALCSNAVTVGCSLCCKHYCSNDHMKCDCGSDFHHTLQNCECSNDNDCFFRALAKNSKLTKVRVKKAIHKFLKNSGTPKILDGLIERYALQDYYSTEDIIYNATVSLQIEQMAEVDTLLVSALALNCNLMIYNDDNSTTHYFEFSPNSKTIFMRFFSSHYEACEDRKLPAQEPIIGPADLNWNHADLIFPQPVVENLQKKKDTPPSSVTSEESVIVNEPIFERVSIDLASEISEVNSLTERYIETQHAFVEQHKNIYGDSNFNRFEKKIENKSNSILSFFKSESLFETFSSIGNFFKDCSVDLLTWLDDNPIVTGIVTIIMGIGSFFGLFVNLPTSKEGFSGIIEKFNSATRTMHYAQSGFRGLATAFTDVIGECKSYLGIAKDKEIEDFKAEVGQMLVMSKELLLLAQTRPGEFVNNSQKCLEFQKSFAQVNKQYQTLSKMKADKQLTVINPIWFALNRANETLMKIYAKFVNCMQCRQVPVCLFVWGPTDVGKSTFATHVVNLINKKLNKEYSTFTISKGTKHWNNFSGHAVIRIDDLNAIVGPDGDTDSVHFFNLVTDAPFNPEQAGLEDKPIMANPEFVIVCSNHPTVPSNTMVSDVTAWERRRHFFVHASFPEHERDCTPGSRSCDHFKDKDPTNFDHLEFRIADPCISKYVDDKKGYKRKFVTSADGVVLENSELISVGDLVNAMIEKRQRHEDEYNQKLAAATAKPIQLQSQACTWEENPTVVLSGPPGTGKTHIFNILNDTLASQPDSKVLRILDNESLKTYFTLLEKIDMPYTHVIVDDVSAHMSEPNLIKRLFAEIQLRYNRHDVKLNHVLYVGLNRQVLDSADLAFSNEYLDVVFRRCEMLETRFKKRLLTRKPYTHQDVSSNVSKINDYVQYIYKGENYLQASIPGVLAKLQPKEKILTTYTSIPIKPLSFFQGTCIAKSTLSNIDLMRAVNEGSFMNLVSLVNSMTIKKVKQSKLDHSKLSMEIGKLVKRCKNQSGTTFDSIEDVFIQSYNSGFLGFLQGEFAILQLKDLIIGIDATSPDHIEMGRMENVNPEMETLFADLGDVVDYSTNNVLDAISSNIFPPWVFLAGSSIMSIIQFAATGFAIGSSLNHLTVLHKAYKEMNARELTYEEVRKEVSNRADRDALNALGLVPGPGYPGMPQYGEYSAIRNAFEASGIEFEEVSPPNRKSKAERSADVRREEVSPPKNKSKAERSTIRHEEVSPPNKKSKAERSAGIRKENVTMQVIANEYLKSTMPMSPLTHGPIMEKKHEVQLQYSGDSKTVENAVMEVVTDPSLYPTMHMAMANMCEIVTLDGKRLCQGLFVRGNLIRTVYHLLIQNDVQNLRCRTLDGKVWPVEEVSVDPIIDCLHLRVPDKNFPAKRSIVAHFPRKANIIRPGQEAILVCLNRTIVPNSNTFTIRRYRLNTTQMHVFDKLKTQYLAIDYRGHRLGYSIDDNVQTTFGDCGGILILSDATVSHGKVIGMHFAASTVTGYASPLWNEQYDEIKLQTKQLEISYDKEYIVPYTDEDEPSIIGQLKKRVFIPNETRLYRNLIPIGPKMYEPAVLCSEDPRSLSTTVLYDQSIKWCNPDRPVLDIKTKERLYSCMVDIAKHTTEILRSEGVSLCVLTNTQAINKYKYSCHSKPIDIHTSSGYPYCLMAKGPGKTDYITVLDDDGSRRFNKKNPSLVNKLQTGIDRIIKESPGEKQKVVPFQVFLKDEPVQMKKIYDETRTRTIAAAPLDFSIAYRRYFHTAHCAMMDFHHKLPFKPGIDPQSADWHQLYMSLASNSDLALDWDFKGWDFSADPYIIWLLTVFYEILFSNLDPNYEEDHQRIRENIYSHVYKFKLIIGSYLYQSTGGIPSGYPGTTPDNCIINFLLSYYAYCELAEPVNPKLVNLYSFLEEVVVADYGDDKLESVKPYTLEFYNGVTVPPVLAKIGFKVTPADKESEFQISKPLKSCIFLSRTFRFESGLWLGPLIMIHLCKPSWWIRDSRKHLYWQSPDEPCRNLESITSSYESMLYEAALHGKEIFNEFYQVALRIYDYCRIRPPPNYNECMQRMYGLYVKPEEIEDFALCLQEDLLPYVKSLSMPHLYRKFDSRISWSYGVDYSYSGSNVKSNKMPDFLKQLLDVINERFKTEHNSILVNHYPPGGGIPWHKDNEPELDLDNGVSCLTVQGDGIVEFRGVDRKAYYMKPGMFYHMGKECLLKYYHRRTNHNSDTYSLTFRKIN